MKRAALIGIILVLVGLWILNKVRIIVFMSSFKFFMIIGLVGFGAWLVYDFWNGFKSDEEDIYVEETKSWGPSWKALAFLFAIIIGAFLLGTVF